MATMPRPTPGNPPGSYCPVSGTSQVAIRNVCADFGAELREFNSETGHVHLLVRYPPRVALSRLVGSLKSVSARRLRQEFPGHIRKYLRVSISGPRRTSPRPAAAHRSRSSSTESPPVGTSEAKSRQPLPDVPGFFVEQVAGAGRPVRADAEAVARETGEDVQMEVEDLLEGGLAVGEEHIHALTAQPRPPQRPADAVAGPPDVHAGFLVQVLQARGVQPGHDKDMPGCHRPQVHEGHHAIIGEGHARLRLTGNDGTKNASTLILAAHREMIP